MLDLRHLATWLAIALGFAILFALTSCRCQRTPNAPPDLARVEAPVAKPPVALVDCPASMKLPVTADVCVDLFFGDLPCARCETAGCHDVEDGIFCVKSCVDERCVLQVPDTR